MLAPLCAGCGVRVPRPAGPAGHHEAALRQAEAQQPPPRPRHTPVQPQQVREDQQRFVFLGHPVLTNGALLFLVRSKNNS